MKKRGPSRTSLSDFVDFASDSSDSDSSASSSSQSPRDSMGFRRRRRGDDDYDSDEDLEVMIKSRRKRRRHFGDDEDDESDRYKRPIAFVKKGLAADEILKHEYDEEEEEDNNGNKQEEEDEDDEEEGYKEQSFSFGRGGLGYNKKGDTRKNYSNFLDMNNGKDAFDSVYGKGSKILKSMGWNTGEGLGKEKDGIAEPIQVKLRPKGRGLGCGVDEKTEQQKRLEQQQQQQQQQKKRASPNPTGAPAETPKGNVGYAALPEDEKLWKRAKRPQKPKYIVVDDDDDAAGYIGGSSTWSGMKGENEEAVAVAAPREIITDMRGPHARIVGSVAEALKAGYEEEEESGASAAGGNPLLPLQHNVQLLASMARERMQANSRRANEAGTTLAALERSVTRETQTLEATRRAVQRLGELRSAVAGVAAAAAATTTASQGAGGVDSRELCASLRALRNKFPEEWARFNFDGLALGMSKPVLVRKLDMWNPITDPTDYLDEFDEWKHLFVPGHGNKEEGEADDNDDDNDGFSNMLTEVFLPRVRAAALRWDARDYEPMINFLALWAPVLTRTVRDYITANVVFPRLQAEVGAWNPRTDPVPVHQWLHPWLPVLGAAVLEPLWAPVRQKMGAALAAWQPADPSAHAVLAPWAPVFGEAGMAGLLARCVVPKLAAELRRHGVAAGPLGADPQQLPRAELVARLGARPFAWAAGWADLLTPDAAAQLLEADFLPAWARALLAWVGGSGGKVDTEVGWWYQGWKSLFPEALLRHRTVQRYFKYALDLMACALAGKPFPPLPTKSGQSPVSPSLKSPSSSSSSSSSAAVGGYRYEEDGSGLTLREVLEQLAARSNVLFTPTSKMHEGKDVYKFGTTSVVVDSKLIYAYVPETGKWETITLDELVRKSIASQQSATSTSTSYDDVE